MPFPLAAVAPRSCRRCFFILRRPHGPRLRPNYTGGKTAGGTARGVYHSSSANCASTALAPRPCSASHRTSGPRSRPSPGSSPRPSPRWPPAIPANPHASRYEAAIQRPPPPRPTNAHPSRSHGGGRIAITPHPRRRFRRRRRHHQRPTRLTFRRRGQSHTARPIVPAEALHVFVYLNRADRPVQQREQLAAPSPADWRTARVARPASRLVRHHAWMAPAVALSAGQRKIGSANVDSVTKFCTSPARTPHRWLRARLKIARHHPHLAAALQAHLRRSECARRDAAIPRHRRRSAPRRTPAPRWAPRFAHPFGQQRRPAAAVR